MATVGGIGAGLFVIFFFLGLGALVCLLGSCSKYARLIYCASTTVVLVVVLFVAAYPRKSQGESTEYDNSQYTRVGFMCLSLAMLCLGGAVTCALYVTPKTQTQIVLDEHTD